MLNCTVSCPSDMQSCRMWRWWEGPVGWGRILTGQKEDLKQGLCCGWSNESNKSNLIIFDLISYIFLLLKSSESSDSRGSFSTSWGLSSSFRGRQKASCTPVSRKYATARVSIPWKVHNSVSNCTKLSNKGNRGTNGSFESYRCGDRADMGDSGRMYEHFQLSSIASWRPKALCQHSWPGKYNAARLSWHLLCFFLFLCGLWRGLSPCGLHHTKASMISVLMTMAALQRKSVAVAVCRMPVAARVISSRTSRQCFSGESHWHLLYLLFIVVGLRKI